MTESLNNVEVLPDAVRATGTYAYDIAQQLIAALGSASNDVDALTSGGWTGAASAAFGAGWAELRQGSEQIFDALTDMAQLLGVNADNYTARDDANAADISSLDL